MATALAMFLLSASPVPPVDLPPRPFRVPAPLEARMNPAEYGRALRRRR